MPINRRKNICPICEFDNKNYKIYLKKNLKSNLLNEYSFSSRKTPEFMNFELIQCSKCSLIYSLNIPEFEKIYISYRDSTYCYVQDEKDAARTYLKYLKPYFAKNSNKFLEIGAGSGQFLELLKKNRAGEGGERYDKNKIQIMGIEPSKSAINNANIEIAKNLNQGFFEDMKVNQNYYESIFCFMTMEHVYHPLNVLKKSYSCLKKRGFIALVIHDVNFILHKILKKKSPIIDVEHLQLFSKKTIIYSLKKAGFKNIETQYIKNSYRIVNWISLLPFSKFFKNFIIKTLIILNLQNVRLSINVGNILVVAYK
jgi:ubiquinone/menaquinone biosynthesis C-methylase UbiE